MTELNPPGNVKTPLKPGRRSSSSLSSGVFSGNPFGHYSHLRYDARRDVCAAWSTTVNNVPHPGAGPPNLSFSQQTVKRVMNGCHSSLHSSTIGWGMEGGPLCATCSLP